MQSLDPRIRWVWMLGWAVPVAVAALVTLGMAVGGVPVGPWIAGGVGLVLLASGSSVPFLAYRNWGYELRPDELVLRHGVITKVERWVPRLRIQHVDLVGGPVERMLGLRQLVIYTAGTREADVKIPGLTVAVAEALRGHLLEWTREGGTKAAPTDADPVYDDGEEMAAQRPPDARSGGEPG